MVCEELMDKKIAAQIREVLLECSGKVDESLGWVQKSCSQEEFQEYRRAAGKIMGAIYFEALEPIFREYPDLQPEGMKKDIQR
jgi:hypothetical protein